MNLFHCLPTSEVNKKFAEIGLPPILKGNDETIVQGACTHLSAFYIEKLLMNTLFLISNLESQESITSNFSTHQTDLLPIRVLK